MLLLGGAELTDRRAMDTNAQEIASQLGKSVEGIAQGLLKLVEDTRIARSQAAADKEAANESRQSMEEAYKNLETLQAKLDDSIAGMKQERNSTLSRKHWEGSRLRLGY